MKLHISKAEINDCDEIARIYNQYVGKATMDLEPKTGAYFEAFIQKNPDREMCYVAIHDSKTAGYGIIKEYSDREGYRLAAETSIYFDQSAISKGYGKQMQLYLIECAKNIGYRHLVAKIWTSNYASVRFHESLGYNIVGVQEKIGFVEGEWKDVTIMQYLVN